jgi:hypothetical protein
VSGDLAQRPALRFGQDEFFPGGGGLDPLGEIVEPGARLNPASVPKLAAQLGLIAGTRTERRARRLDMARGEAELRDDVFHLAIEPAKVFA